MKAIILSAGQGSRLLPLTQDLPKCLLPLGSRSVLEWQIGELARCGIDEVVVVVGFRAQAVEDVLAPLERPGLAIRTVFNPFYHLADNLASCWMARHEMAGDFVLLNGDTVFQAPILQRLLAAPAAPVTLTIDRKAGYDADDMKVQTEGGRLLAVGKTLPLDMVDGESIGMTRFRGDGPRRFTDALEAAMRTPEGLKWWYLRVIGLLAAQSLVQVCSIEGLAWGEVDYVPDLARAQALVAGWTGEGEAAVSARSGA
jgi:choline kinase